MAEAKVLSQSRKRPFDESTAKTQKSRYYKLHAGLKDLRPHIIEVLKTPDLRNCKAASDFHEGVKLIKDLCKDIVEENIELDKRSKPTEHSSSDILNGQKPTNPQQDVKPAEKTQPKELSGHLPHGTYIVGGSAFGWNFITFGSTKAVYYGRTKEAFRATNPALTE
ncbi:hypothetical protein CDL12_27534 [Handroanthus impetiginosus]|uniref:Uncharacterized protein n=1 Tax=Handroanthus impetiginosus TaxID=429701 RepID=A0A2G9G445_9LAMI|nr:hypothetical protein CDL12_27534 [Handroanthus impetiginosus]